MDETRGHWTVVREVISSTTDGAMVMSALPGLVRRLLDESAWRIFTTPDGGVVRHEKFKDFVEAVPPRGLGGRTSQLLVLCGDDESLRRDVTKELARETMPAKPHGVRGPAKRQSATLSFQKRDAGEILARLKRDDPAMAEQVIQGDLSANAAARQKGWRYPRILVTSPSAVAASLAKYLDTADLRLLASLLIEESKRLGGQSE